MTHERILQHIELLPIVSEWQTMLNLLRRVAEHKDPNWELPLAACAATGGQDEDSIAAAAAVACVQISIILIDDILDNDPRGEQHRIGLPLTINLAAGFQAAAGLALATRHTNMAVSGRAAECLARIVAATAFGQQLDTQPINTVEDYWQLIRHKSAPFFAGAFEIGALVGGAQPMVAQQLRNFGILYGEIIQIYDDLRDTMAIPASPDWTQGRSPLPILFASTVEHSNRQRFSDLKSAWADPAALSEAQDILIRCGAVSYCVDAIVRRCDQAQKMLEMIDLSHPEIMDQRLSNLRRPVENLLATVRCEPMGETLSIR